MDSIPSREAQAAAYWRGNDPALTQREIGEKANLGTQAQVSGLLAEAREKGVLREVFQFAAGLSADLRHQIENSFFNRHSALENALADRARILNDTRSEGGSFFKKLHVVAAPDTDSRVSRERFSLPPLSSVLLGGRSPGSTAAILGETGGRSVKNDGRADTEARTCIAQAGKESSTSDTGLQAGVREAAFDRKLSISTDEGQP